jgi:glycerophosphoryl diester phosphodiesterase
LINIEVKTPKDLAVRPLYDTDRLSAVLHEKLQDGFDLSQLEKGAVSFSFISSFDHAFIEKYQAWEAKNKTPEDSKAHFIYLYSRRPEDLMPEKKVTDAWSKGTNCQPSCATPENIQRFHENNQIVGVWIDKAVHTNEGPELWMELMSLGVDMFCTDHPLEVIECRDSMLPQN